MADLSRRDLDEVYACRIELEGLAAAQAARARSPADLDSLDERLEALTVARDRASPRDFLRASMALSRAIHEASHNRTLIRLLSTLEPQAMRYRYVAYVRAESLMDASLEGNGAVAESIHTGDCEAASAATHTHDPQRLGRRRTGIRRKRRGGAGGVSGRRHRRRDSGVVRVDRARDAPGPVARSSYSSIIYEGYDFSCVLVDCRRPARGAVR